MFIYILTNERRTTLYIGVTNDLARRVSEHGEREGSSFTHPYNLAVLIYFEEYPDPIQRSPARSSSKAGRARRRRR